jgi:hypothetical protein
VNAEGDKLAVVWNPIVTAEGDNLAVVWNPIVTAEGDKLECIQQNFEAFFLIIYLSLFITLVLMLY